MDAYFEDLPLAEAPVSVFVLPTTSTFKTPPSWPNAANAPPPQQPTPAGKLNTSPLQLRFVPARIPRGTVYSYESYFHFLYLFLSSYKVPGNTSVVSASGGRAGALVPRPPRPPFRPRPPRLPPRPPRPPLPPRRPPPGVGIFGSSIMFTN